MGAETSKKQKNDQLKKIGANANKDHPSSFCCFTPINITNDLLVSKLRTNPEEDYKKLNFLGEGSFGAVYRVQNKYTYAICAMKIINKSSNSPEDDKEILNEINILRSMDHPSVLKIFEFYSNRKSYSIITELCTGGELFQQIIDKGPFNEKYTAFVMYQLFSAVNYCHKMHIVHRDLKPENILIISKDKDGYPTIKVCDFGTSKIFEKGKIERKFVGSSYYIAPEVLKQKYNEKCDLWSCGVIMYILLTGIPPFGGSDNKTIIKKILVNEFDKTKLKKKCKACIDLIEKLLERDVKKRIRAEAALNHKWFKIYKSYEIRVDIEDPKKIEFYINNLKNYKKSSEIQEIALAYLVHNHPELEEINNAGKLFEIIDKKGKGKINKEEFYNGLSEFYKSANLKNDIDKIFENIDINNDLYIEYEEFVRAAIDRSIFLSSSYLKFAFKYFDRENKGEITVDDLCSIFSGDELSKNEIDRIRKIVQKISLDEKIRYKEFCTIMKSFIGQQ